MRRASLVGAATGPTQAEQAERYDSKARRLRYRCWLELCDCIADAGVVTVRVRVRRNVVIKGEVTQGRRTNRVTRTVVLQR